MDVQNRETHTTHTHTRASQVALVVKNPPANVGDTGDVGSIPGSGKSPGEGNGHPFQYSCLNNPMDRGAWWATVQRVSKSWTQLKRLNMHTHTHTHFGFSKSRIYIAREVSNC